MAGRAACVLVIAFGEPVDTHIFNYYEYCTEHFAVIGVGRQAFGHEIEFIFCFSLQSRVQSKNRLKKVFILHKVLMYREFKR